MNNRTGRAVVAITLGVLGSILALTVSEKSKRDPGSPKPAHAKESQEKATVEPPLAHQIDFEGFLDALAVVETGNRDQAVGDQGLALGRFQIHRCYWQDAVDFDRTIGGSYNQVTDPAYARKIVRAYLRRYGKTYISTRNWEALARIHNGGPSILKRKGSSAWKNTTTYWLRVKDVLDGCNNH